LLLRRPPVAISFGLESGARLEAIRVRDTRNPAMPTPKWQRFEQLVAAIHHVESEGATVLWNDTINGRQFDVTVRFSFSLESYLTVIECKDKASKVPVTEVEAFVTKARDVNASKAVMVSSKGYQSGCFPVADRHGVRLLVLTEDSSESSLPLNRGIVPMLNINLIQFERTDYTTYELEDEGGKLAFLGAHTKVNWGSAEVTVEQLINDWQLGKVQVESVAPEEVRIPFAGGAMVCVPQEEQFQASAMRFTVRQINGFRAEGPTLDAHIRHTQATELHLSSHDGIPVKRFRLWDVPQGFHTTIEVGKFYFDPLLHSSYYCEEIETGDILNMTMVESYQHGHLIQAQFTAKRANARNYLEIKDETKLRHLTALLAELKKKRACESTAERPIHRKQ
jgi:hypothetical protein